MNKSIYFIVFLFVISCSPVSSQWSCKTTVDGVCKNIKEIDSGMNNNTKILLKNKETINLKHIKSFDDYRSKESVARVVFSPYIDSAGNRHDFSTVYYLEQKAEWKK